MSRPRRIVIVGHGIAGLTAAQAARQQDPQAEIVIVGEEPYDAYYRPRLTHDLAQGIEVAGLLLRPPAWYQQQRVSVRRGVRVQALDPAAGQVHLGGAGPSLAYDACILATGSTSFMPPIQGAAGWPGVFTLRTAADAIAIRARALTLETKTAVVAGGGLLGLEAAYGLSRLGARVLVLERGPWLLRRQLDRDGGEVLAAVLRRAGIEVLTGTEVEAVLDGELTLRGGQQVSCGLLVVAAGVRPSMELAQAAGITCDRGGVVVDGAMATSQPMVFAGGDVASHAAGNYSIWPQAMAQGRVAGINAAGGSALYQPVVPQALLEVAGTSVFAVGEAGESPVPSDFLEVWRKDPAAGRYAKLRLRGGALAGAMLIGHPELVGRVRGPVESRQPVLDPGDAAALAQRPEKGWEEVLARLPG